MEFWLIVGGIFFLILLPLYKGVTDRKKAQAELKKSLKVNYGQANKRKWQSGEIELISRYNKMMAKDSYLDSLTWNDLDMELVFKKMAYTGSSLGDDYLYALLNNPKKNEEELLHLERKLSFYHGNEEARVNLQLLFHELGRMKKYSLCEYVNYMMELVPGKNLKHHLANAVLLAAFLLLPVSTAFGLFIVFLVLLYNLYTYFRDKAGMDPYLTSFRYILNMLDMVGKVEKELDPVWQEEKDDLREALTRLKGFRQNTFLLMTRGRMGGQGLELILDYLRMCLHLDVIKFNHMLSILQKNEALLWKLYAFLGELDACFAICAYRASLPWYCLPDFIEKGKVRIEEGYHPLVDNPVANSLNMKKNVLLTGSNASGKSTFLKTMGINLLLAQTIHTCTAKELHLPHCRLYTAITLKDSIQNQESYYMAEIKAIKRILDGSRQEGYVVCLIDEVLKGTNTMERIAASTQILKKMREMGIICIAATHDGELTKTLMNDYDNYHFQEELKEGDIHFSYKIREGAASTSNAIIMLEQMGYGNELVTKARQMIKEFEKRGEWR